MVSIGHREGNIWKGRKRSRFAEIIDSSRIRVCWPKKLDYYLNDLKRRTLIEGKERYPTKLLSPSILGQELEDISSVRRSSARVLDSRLN